MLLAGLCKGSTTDSDSVCEGSNPSPAANKQHTSRCAVLFYISKGFADSPIRCTAGAGSRSRAAGSNPSPAAIKQHTNRCAVLFYISKGFADSPMKCTAGAAAQAR